MKPAGLMLLMMAIAVASGCQAAAASRPPETDYVMLVDQSGSITAPERAAWSAHADVLLQRLGLGDSILILPVHDQTLNAAPLFHARVPAQGVSLEDLARGKRRLKEIRSAAHQTIGHALESKTQSRGTDVLAVVDRVAAARKSNAGRELRVYIFSDMLQSLPPLNLERTALSPDDIPQHVSRIASAARWRNDLLKGVTFVCVLNGVNSGRRNAVNDRRILVDFWRALFASVGADLASFDTYIQEELS